MVILIARNFIAMYSRDPRCAPSENFLLPLDCTKRQHAHQLKSIVGDQSALALHRLNAQPTRVRDSRDHFIRWLRRVATSL